MNKKELIKFLENIPDDYEIVAEIPDPEWNDEYFNIYKICNKAVCVDDEKKRIILTGL
jgi:hypothetical protein